MSQLAPLLPHERYNQLNSEVRKELKRAAERASVLPLELLRPNNSPHIVKARVQVMRFLRKRGYTYPAIANVFGQHHSTVMAHLRKSGPQKPVPFPDYSGEWAI